MLDQCWPTVYDVGPTLIQHWVNVSRLLGIHVFQYAMIQIIYYLSGCQTAGNLANLICQQMYILFLRHDHVAVFVINVLQTYGAVHS